MKDLIKLLTEVSDQMITEEDLSKAFDEIAVTLLRQSKIVTPNAQFHLREIEFYYYDPKLHPDTYAHKNNRQLEFGEWYFHRFGNINSFLKSNRNGVDLTFGNRDRNIFGGILIRKIQDIETGVLIAGINKVARALIENTGEENINHLAKNIGQTAFNRDLLLHLEVDGNNYSMPIYKSQRNGLTFKNDEIANKFYKAAYCYYNHNFNISQIVEVRSSV